MMAPEFCPPRARPACQSGMAILECLMYIVMLFLVMGMAYAGFYEVLEHTTRLQRSAADITRAVQAGELWRADVRNSLGMPKLEELEGQMVWQIPQANKEVSYLFKGDTVYRQEGKAVPKPFLAQVKSSRMLVDKGQQVSSCRWEVELAGGKKQSKLKPLFTFQAVPGK